MKIVGVDRFTLWVDWCNWLLVRVRTDEGLYGWGEGSLHGGVAAVEAAVDDYASHLIGHDPAGPERHWHRLYNMWRWRGGCVAQTALSALDIALWDLEGKRLGVPLHRLLGGAHRDRVRCYASHWLGGATTPEAAAEGAREAVRRGYTAFKWIAVTYEGLRAGEAAAIGRAADMMAAAREAAGPHVDIMVECSEFLSPRTAERLDRALAPYDPYWLEEPIPYENAKVMAQLQARLSAPIATGERLLSRQEFRELFELGGCRIAQPDVMHCGGITELRRIASMADAYNIQIAPHNPGGPICVAASLHLAAVIPNFLILEQMEIQRAARDRLSSPALVIDNGFYRVPDGPGLGVDIDVEAVKAITMRQQPRKERTGAIYT